MSFLTDDEKRVAAGYGPKEEPISLPASQKYSPDQPRVPAGNSDGGQWTSGGGGASSSGAGLVLSEATPDTFWQPGTQLAQVEPTKPHSVDLEQEERQGGHTIRDHVAKSDWDLKTYLDAYVIRGPFVSIYKDAEGSFLSKEQANDLVNQLIKSNTDRVGAVASGALEEDWIAERFGYQTGKEAYREGPHEASYIRPTYAAGVLIRHDQRSPQGYIVITAYPLNERSKR